MILENYLKKIQTPGIIFFPKEEWKSVKKRLENGEEVSSTRNSCGKNKRVFKVGQKYKTDWGMKIKITKVQHFDNPEKIPAWNKMTKAMQKSIKQGIKMCGTDNLQWIHLRKI